MSVAKCAAEVCVLSCAAHVRVAGNNGGSMAIAAVAVETLPGMHKLLRPDLSGERCGLSRHPDTLSRGLWALSADNNGGPGGRKSLARSQQLETLLLRGKRSRWRVWWLHAKRALCLMHACVM